jgi:hypothetical protein
MFEERTLRGRDSREPPKMEDGARALTEALVSREWRRRRLEEDANVRIDALSVRRLFAVAVEYVVGFPLAGPVEGGWRWGGTAEAGGEVGNWWENCTPWVFEGLC